MKRTILAVAAATWAAFSLAACQRSHAPTFKELNALPGIKDEKFATPDDMAEVQALHHAMQFTTAELRKIKDSGDVRLLLGAGAVSNDPLGLELLRLAGVKAPDDPVPMAALAYRAVGFEHWQEIAEPEFVEILDRWRKLKPQNSAPYYLEAIRLAKGEKFEEVARALAEASRHPSFDLHCAALRLDIVAAGDFIGYPKFTARYFAFTFLPEFQFFLPGSRCLKWEGANEQIARDCIVLGKRMAEDSKTAVEELAGTALQLAAAKKYPQLLSAAEQKQIAERRKRLGELVGRVEDLSPRLSEKRSLALLDQILYESEAAADEKLIAEYGDSSK
jgi:hypothetical protein